MPNYFYGPKELPQAPDEVMAYRYVIMQYNLGSEDALFVYAFETEPETELYTAPIINKTYDRLKCYGSYANGSWYSTVDPETWIGVKTNKNTSDLSGGYVSIKLSDIFWANFDIYTSDGDLYLAASDPVPVNSPIQILSPLTILSGFQTGTVVRLMREKIEKKEPVGYLYGTPSENGNIGLRVGDVITYYKGAVLPELPEFDKQYAVIRGYTDEQAAVSSFYGRRYLHVSEEPFYVKGSDSSYNQGLYLYNLETQYWESNYGTDEAWKYKEEFTTDNQVVYDPELSYTNYHFLWANHPIVNTVDNSTYCAATDPIPVSGIVDYVGDIPIYE